MQSRFPSKRPCTINGMSRNYKVSLKCTAYTKRYRKAALHKDLSSMKERRNKIFYKFHITYKTETIDS